MGQEALTGLGVRYVAGCTSRGLFACGCVNLTRRFPYFAGALGAGLLAVYVRKASALGTNATQVVNIAPKGAAAFKLLWQVSS